MNSNENTQWDTPENLNYKPRRDEENPKFKDNFSSFNEPTQPVDSNFKETPKFEEQKMEAEVRSKTNDYDFSRPVENNSYNIKDERLNEPVQANFKSENFKANPAPIKEVIVNKRVSSGTILSLLTMSLLAGLLSGFLSYTLLPKILKKEESSIQNPITQLEQVKVVEEESGTINVAKSSLDSVVSIVGSRSFNTNNQNLRDLLSGEEGKPISREVSAGTGFMITDDGYIITNKHVIEDKNLQYTVVFNDGSEVAAEILDYDKILDIGFLKIDPTKLPNPPKALNIGDSSSIQVGQTAIAIGNSLGEFRNTVSKGIISGLDRSIVASDASGANAENLENIIQTDASINTGNSGGPLLDIHGNVIGVNVARAQTGESIGFSIPINSVKGILDSVIRTGKIVRPYLGVAFINITPEISKNQNLPVNEGAWISAKTGVNAISPGSPADKAGLKNGDIITKVNGKKIHSRYTLTTAIAEIPVGKIAELTVLRDGKEETLRATLVEMPSNYR